MSNTSTPRPPAGLGKSGRALWRRIVTDYELDPPETVLLEMACRQADDVAALEAEIEGSGVVSEGSTGQPVISRALSEVRQGRAAVAKLLAQIGLPPADAPAANTAPAEPETAASRRARNAAEKRWANVARLPRGKGA